MTMGACKNEIFLFQTGNTVFEQVRSKNQNCQFQLKLGTQTKLNMQNSLVTSTFSVFHRKYHFWANLVPKFKIVCLRWNLVLRLIRICRIQWWCSPILFQTRNTLFGQIQFEKIRIVSLSLNWVLRLFRISRIQWWCSLLLF